MGRMLGQDSLRRAVQAAGIDTEPRWFDELGSTNTLGMELGSEGAPEWTVVATGHQTAGRGRLGRTWTDAPGDSLLVSILLRPRLGPDEAPLLGLLAATALVEAAGREVLLSKWPNDVVAGNRKVGGILAEAHVGPAGVEHMVVGTGVNVTTPEEGLPAEVRATATSLAAVGAETDPERLLGRFLAIFRDRYEDRAFPAGVAERYAQVCATIGREVRAITNDGREVRGQAVGVDGRGALLVRSDGRQVTVSSGEVVHLR